jgi:hypothetical protein
MTHEGGNTGRDHVYSERWGVAPSFAFGLDSPTTVSIAYLHQDESKLTDYGIPVVTVGGIGRPVTDFGVASSNFYGYRADMDETTVDTVTVRLLHEATDWLTLTSDVRWGNYQRYARFTPAGCAGVCVTNLTDGDPATIPRRRPAVPARGIRIRKACRTSQPCTSPPRSAACAASLRSASTPPGSITTATSTPISARARISTCSTPRAHRWRSGHDHGLEYPRHNHARCQRLRQ